MSIVINLLLAIHIIVSLLIILIVLMQRPKNEGLGAAFGGGMTENLFGAQTTNVLSTITRWLCGIFIALTLALAILYSRQSNTKSPVQERLSKAPKPIPATVASPTPAPMENPASVAPPELPEGDSTSAPALQEKAPAKPAPDAKPATPVEPSKGN